MAAASKADFLRRHHTFHDRHATVSDPLFDRGDFFDPRDLLMVKCEMLRRVRVGDRTAAAAARDFGLSRSALYEADARWARGGLAALVPARPGPRGPHKLTPEVLAFLARAGGREAPGGVPALAEQLRRELSVRVHPRTLERALGGRKKGATPGHRRRRTGPAGTRRCAWPG